MSLSKEILQLLDRIRDKTISVRDVSKETEIPEQRIYNWKNKNILPSKHEDVEKLQAYAEAHKHLLNDDPVQYGSNRIGILEDKVAQLEADIIALKAGASILLGEIASMQSSVSGEPVGSILLRLQKAGKSSFLLD